VGWSVFPSTFFGQKPYGIVPNGSVPDVVYPVQPGNHRVAVTDGNHWYDLIKDGPSNYDPSNLPWVQLAGSEGWKMSVRQLGEFISLLASGNILPGEYWQYMSGRAVQNGADFGGVAWEPSISQTGIGFGDCDTFAQANNFPLDLFYHTGDFACKDSQGRPYDMYAQWNIWGPLTFAWFLNYREALVPHPTSSDKVTTLIREVLDFCCLEYLNKQYP
jgi:hypothetical protein